MGVTGLLVHPLYVREHDSRVALSMLRGVGLTASWSPERPLFSGPKRFGLILAAKRKKQPFGAPGC